LSLQGARTLSHVVPEEVVSDRVLTVPNLLSVVRLALVPVFAWLVLIHQDLTAIGVLALSGFTDWLDGALARRWQQITRVGQLLDPAADRLFIVATLLALAYRGVIPWWLVILLIVRDVLLTATIPLLAQYRHGPLPVHFAGKAATFNLLYAFPLLLLGQWDGALGEAAKAIGWAFAWWGVALYWWAAVLYLTQVQQVIAGARRDSAGPAPVAAA
jgi:cardiolipin synthase